MKSRAKLLAALLAGIFVFSFAIVSCSNGSDSSPLAFIPTSPTNPTEPTNGGTGGDNGSGGGTTTNPTNPTNPEQQTQTTFTVTFQTERGTLPDQFKNGITVNENDKLTAEQLPGLTADGFAFGGWLDGETLVVAGEYTVTKNVVLTAKWTVATVQYTVSFASEHGTVPQTVTLPENTVLMETNIPTLEEEGWRFDGWFDGDTKIQAGSYTLTKNLALSAKWTKTYKVTFSSEFGQAPVTLVLTENTVMTTENLPVLEQEGYVFEGWFDGEIYANAGEYKASKDVALIAKWHVITYKICFINLLSSNSDVVDNAFAQSIATMGDQTFSYGEEKTLSAVILPNNNSVKFLYWRDANGNQYTDKALVKDLSTNDGDIITLQAVYLKVGNILKNITLNSNLKDGNEISTNHSFYVSYDDSGYVIPTKPNSFENKGYRFVGWNSKEDGSGTVYNVGDTLTFDQASNLSNLYAQWTANKGVIHFDANGGTGTMEDIEFYSGKFSIPECAFTKDYCDFVCWAPYADDVVFSQSQSGNDYYAYWLVDGAEITIRPEWKWRSYTVKFQANGDPMVSLTGTMPSQTITFGSETNLTKNAFVYEEHVFKGWNTKADGSGTNYADEAAVTNIGDITLYAQWEGIPYTIRFDPNNGDPVEEKVFYYANNYYNYKTSNPNYNQDFLYKYIKSWNTKPDGSGIAYNTNGNPGTLYFFNPRTELEMESGTVKTLYAQWNQMIYSVYLNGGPEGASGLWGQTESGAYRTTVRCEAGKYYKFKNPFIREGYSFKDWNGRYTEDDEIQIVKDRIELYANWGKTPQIQFNANGGTGSMANIGAHPNEEITLPQNTFTYDGYNFICWRGANGNCYFEGDKVCNLVGIGKTYTLYAMWGKDGDSFTVPASSALRMIECLPYSETNTYTLELTGNCDEDILAQIGTKLREKNVRLKLHLENTTGLTKISGLAECENLISLYLSRNTTIGIGALYNCSKLSDIVFTDYNKRPFCARGYSSDGEQQIQLEEETETKFRVSSSYANGVLNYTASRALGFLVHGYPPVYKGHEYEWRVIE